MAKSLVFLEYTFIFDSNDTWQRLSQFENDLADFFVAYDLEAKIIKTVGGQMGKRIMLISKVKGKAEKAVEPRESKPIAQKLAKMIKPEVKRVIKKDKSPFISKSLTESSRPKLRFSRGKEQTGSIGKLSMKK